MVSPEPALISKRCLPRPKTWPSDAPYIRCHVTAHRLAQRNPAVSWRATVRRLPKRLLGPKDLRATLSDLAFADYLGSGSAIPAAPTIPYLPEIVTARPSALTRHSFAPLTRLSECGLAQPRVNRNREPIRWISDSTAA